MRRALVIALLAATLAGGCIRIDFDLCEEEPPHPDCVTDAGTDGAAAELDAGATAADAGVAPDGG